MFHHAQPNITPTVKEFALSVTINVLLARPLPFVNPVPVPICFSRVFASLLAPVVTSDPAELASYAPLNALLVAVTRFAQLAILISTF